MAGGLVALLDDIAALTKLAAASLDDVASATAGAGSKAAGVVIDDAAVTPRYVVGLTPDRELPIIAKIALGSLKNKLVILLPAALLLSAIAPWAITPLLMLGGSYLCFEAAEKIHEALGGGHHAERATVITDPRVLEERQVSGAIRTDLILSAEIMAIALGELPAQTLVMQGIVLALVGLGITVGVYGVVALLVKMDDIGLHLARRRHVTLQAIGRGLVKAMPLVLQALSTIGTAAMIWVGGGIILHGGEALGLAAPAEWLHHLAETAGAAVPLAGGLVGWLVYALGAAVVGLLLGAVLVAGIGLATKRRGAA
ncbi:MAG: ABC transporter [Sphingomonas sp. 28-62-20]|uniref:DUF808 domain-containing protein n=1 Tax=Sphingomonas sp. 28-62-20 TaxID=1970433 RepID=UPI000BDCFFC0|nr:MAG: ABC transporter [Sphingomonas sp. 28-62-20]